MTAPTAQVIAFPYATPTRRQVAFDNQARNEHALWRPRLGGFARCRATGRLLKLTGCSGYQDRALLWSAEDLETGLHVLRPTPDLAPPPPSHTPSPPAA